MRYLASRYTIKFYLLEVRSLGSHDTDLRSGHKDLQSHSRDVGAVLYDRRPGKTCTVQHGVHVHDQSACHNDTVIVHLRYC